MVSQSILLRDNYINDRSQIDKITTDDVKNTLRYLSLHPLSELKNDNGDSILVFPHSFEDTKDEIGDSFLLSYSEDKIGNPESITTGNLVGFLGKDGLDIRIHSRFSSSEKKDYFLYYLLEKALSINIFNWDTSLEIDSSVKIFDFLLFFFPMFLKKAMSQGLYKEYVYHEYNNANIHGVVDVNRHLRLNIPANGRIAYRTREFSYDNHLTQLIRHTIEFIRPKPFGKTILHNDPETEGYIQQIIQATPTFQAQKRQVIINENLRPVAHPYYSKYAALQNLCLRILRYDKLSYGESRDKIHGILIDVAWLWEEYIAQVLAEGSDFKHYRRRDGFPLLQRTDTGKQFQTIIPDYLDNRDPNNVLVADAKYIPLDRFDNLSSERAAAIYYKTIMYMYRFNSKKGFLFHPLPQEHLINSELCEYRIISTKGFLYEIGFVIPPASECDYPNFKIKMKKAEEQMRDKILSVI